MAYQKPTLLGIKIQEKVNAQSPPILSHGSPIRLIIPSIHVNAAVKSTGVISDGTMEMPSSVTEVGWYALGSHPGDEGSAVIAGHVSGNNGERGIFADLRTLKTGDVITIEDDKHIFSNFIVRETRAYDPSADASEVFYREDGRRLNLVTCEGAWDAFRKTYTKRLVVFADGAYPRDNISPIVLY
jgi:sortase A